MEQRQTEVDTMNEEEVQLIRQQIRSPRSAAIAGIIHSILMIVAMARPRPGADKDRLLRAASLCSTFTGVHTGQLSEERSEEINKELRYEPQN